MVAKGGNATNGPFDTYLSRPFDAGDASAADQEAAFAAYIRDQYHVTTTDLHRQCTAAATEADGQRMFGVLRDQGSRRGQVIETAWSMKP